MAFNLPATVKYFVWLTTANLGPSVDTSQVKEILVLYRLGKITLIEQLCTLQKPLDTLPAVVLNVLVGGCVEKKYLMHLRPVMALSTNCKID